MWQQPIHTGLRPWRIEDKISFPILLENGVGVAHGHRTISVAVRGYPNSENDVICAKGKRRYSQQDRYGHEENPS